LGLTTCTRPQQTSTIEWVPTTAPDLGGIVAKVAGVPIFAKQVLAEAKTSGRSPREALQRLIDDGVAAQAIRSAGRLPPGSERRDVQAALVQRLLERELETNLQQKDIPDRVLRPLYEKVRDRFVHPRLVEVGMLTIYTGALMKDESRTKRRELASELATFLSTHPAESLEDFAAIAQDRRWADQGVGYRRVIQSPDQPFSKAIGAAVIRLRTPGDTTALLTDETGFYIARYIDEKPAENVTFEQAREQLAAGYLQRWTRERFLTFSTNLIQKHKVEVHFDRLAREQDQDTEGR
jgi:hypothetical protein